MGGNAATPENRAKIYAAMYQAVSEKWVRAGAVSHAICLNAHDLEAQHQFYLYGFGLRCVDGIRPMEPIDCKPCTDYQFLELGPEDRPAVYSLEIMLDKHYRTSPYFMNRPSVTYNYFRDYYLKDARYFGVKHLEELCAFLSVTNEGETYIATGENYKHICGAFCMPKYRGKGVYLNLLNYAISTLKSEGYIRLGTDFESFNPSGAGFWLKHFSAYTHSVVRRIDENMLEI